MEGSVKKAWAIGFAFAAVGWGVAVAKPLDEKAAARRADEVLAKMTLEEKVSLCGLCATMYLNAIPRVGIDREWSFNDCGHCMKPEHNRDRWGYVEGADDQSTALPCISALASTWNTELATRHGHVMGEQMRSRDKSQMLGPGINIMRNPLCGRNWEYMSEDPVVVASMIVPLIRAAQSHGLACTPKHFCVNNQEWNRFNTDTAVSRRALEEIYLPGFEAAIRYGGALSIMTAYNKLNGTFCSENPLTQIEILRNRWGFRGTIVTDWGGQRSCENAVLNGCGIEANCGKEVKYLTDFYGTVSSNKFPLATAVREGRVPEAKVDAIARSVLYVMAKTGFLDGTQEKGERLTPKHQLVAREIGEEAIVLAKNEAGVLPLDKAQMKRVVVFGEVARKKVAHLGSSCECHPLYEVSFLDGLGEYLGKDVKIHYFPLGGEAGEDNPLPIDNLLLKTTDPNGGDAFVVRAWQYAERRDGKVLKEGYRKETKAKWDFDGAKEGPYELLVGDEVEWTAEVRAPETGDYDLLADQGVYSRCAAEVDGRPVFEMRPDKCRGSVRLEQDRVYRITFRFQFGWGKNFCTFGWIPPSARRYSPDDIRATCASADAVLVFTGTTMGFGQAKETEGKDRPNMKTAPGHDEDIARILSWRLPKTVVVCRTGSALELPWLKDCSTMIITSYLGQEAGRPMARTLFGEVNPSGKMTYSWPKRYADTAMAFYGERAYNETRSEYVEGIYVGYRWYEKRNIPVDFAFGHGLSYTSFAYGQPTVEKSTDGWTVRVPVRNAGKRDGAEVVQLYVSPVDPKVDRPVKELKRFAKRALKPGEEAVVEFGVSPRDFAYYDEAQGCFRTDPGTYELKVGSSSADIRGVCSVTIGK